MSARVAIQCGIGSPNDAEEYIYVACPDANHAHVNDKGHLVLSVQDSYSEMAGYFKQWDHVVINQRWLRGPGGRFVSKENR